MKESATQKAILEWLAWKHIFHYRNNCGGLPMESKGQRYYVRFGTLGTPDIVCVINGQYVGIEVKAPKGKQSDKQKEFQRRLEEARGGSISWRIRLMMWSAGSMWLLDGPDHTHLVD